MYISYGKMTTILQWSMHQVRSLFALSYIKWQNGHHTAWAPVNSDLHNHYILFIASIKNILYILWNETMQNEIYFQQNDG